MNLSKKQRRILKLKNSCLHTQLLQNIYSAMYIQKLPLAFLLLLLLKEFLTSSGLNTTKTKAFLYTVKSPEVIRYKLKHNFSGKVRNNSPSLPLFLFFFFSHVLDVTMTCENVILLKWCWKIKSKT